jgi:hypothetical protein
MRYTARDPYTSLPAPVVVEAGNGRPSPGQWDLPLAAAGYREADVTSPSYPFLPIPTDTERTR